MHRLHYEKNSVPLSMLIVPERAAVARVRLLIDDINARGNDSIYLALDAHPNIEVRLFNPSRNRANGVRRGLELAFRVFRVTRRMHNKAWIADGRLAIIGGRNIGNAYFNAAQASNFHDLDLLVAGEAVTQAETIFDRFWNSPTAVPIASLSRPIARRLPSLPMPPQASRANVEALLRVVETPGKLGDIEISPDGTQLSMIAGVDMNDPAETTLHLVDMATGQYRALNAGAPEAAIDAEWLADGRLAAVIHKGAQSALRIYNADGSVAAEHDGGELILSSIQAGGNTIAVEASSPQHPTELFVWKDDGFQRWTTHNDWLKDIDFGKQRAFTYTARDGQEVEGVLIEPVGGAKRGGAPLILNVHGGPEAHDSNGWQTAYSKPGQVAAGQGYAVFLPNYRGSTGYGTAFSKQHTGNYTDPEFTDLVDAKRALVDAGIADPDRTGITGGSYGGYATGWAATALSDEFAAGVMFVGISNQVSKFGTTDIPYEMYNVHSGKWPWDDWQAMLEVSPIYHVDKANTPLLIMHGAEDTRVAPSQSYELYRSMKVRKPDVPVRLVLFPGEGHGNSRAAARYDYNLRMMRWFDTYLKTGDRKAKLPATRPDLPAGTTGTASAD